MSKLIFVPLEFNEDPSYIPGIDYDPDIHLFNQISQNINFNSNHYLEDGLKNCVSEMSTGISNLFFIISYEHRKYKEWLI